MKKKRTKKRLTDELSVRRFLIKMKLPLFLLMILFLSELLKESKNYAIHEFLIQDYASIASKQECLL